MCTHGPERCGAAFLEAAGCFLDAFVTLPCFGGGIRGSHSRRLEGATLSCYGLGPPPASHWRVAVMRSSRCRCSAATGSLSRRRVAPTKAAAKVSPATSTPPGVPRRLRLAATSQPSSSQIREISDFDIPSFPELRILLTHRHSPGAGTEKRLTAPSSEHPIGISSSDRSSGPPPQREKC